MLAFHRGFEVVDYFLTHAVNRIVFVKDKTESRRTDFVQQAAAGNQGLQPGLDGKNQVLGKATTQRFDHIIQGLRRNDIDAVNQALFAIEQGDSNVLFKTQPVEEPCGLVHEVA